MARGKYAPGKVNHDFVVTLWGEGAWLELL
jgi:hypothetical protein